MIGSNTVCIQTKLQLGVWQLLGALLHTKHLLINKYNINKASTIYSIIQFNLGQARATNNACGRCMGREASNVHLTKTRSVLLIRCLPKMPPSSSTSTGSQIATWRRSLTRTMSRVRLRSSTTVDGKDVRLTTGVSFLNPVQRDILPHRHSQLSDLTITLYTTTSLKSISRNMVTLSQNVQTVL